MNQPNGEEQDQRDMALLAGGHETALNELMQRHAENLYRYLVRSLRDEAEAADLAQETFVRVYQNRARFDPTQRFTTWLYTIAGNLVRNRYRWRARHPQVSLDSESPETNTPMKDTLQSAHPAPDQTLQAEERADAVRTAVEALPEELREPLMLAVYQEFSHAEIAEMLQCSVKAVEMRIYRARQQLRTALARLIDAHY